MEILLINSKQEIVKRQEVKKCGNERKSCQSEKNTVLSGNA